MPLSTWAEDAGGGFEARNDKTGVVLHVRPDQTPGKYRLYLNGLEVLSHDGTLDGCRRLAGFYGADPLPIYYPED